MSATQTLPEHYSLRWSFTLKNNVNAAIWLQLATLPMFFGSAWLFYALASWSGDVLYRVNGWVMIVVLIFGMIGIIAVHEIFHGIGFRMFGAKTTYGIGAGYAYAAAPDWYFARKAYLVIALLPLIGISVIGAITMWIIPSAWLWAWVYMLTVNAGGAAGDVYIAIRILFEPGEILVRDLGDGFEVYGM
jgi:hypothetical protein